MSDSPRTNIMMANETSDEMCRSKIPANIFNPTNIRIKDRPFCRWWNLCSTLSRRKKSARSPIMAKIFEVKTTNGFWEIEKAAGIESMAKIMSVVSTRRMIRNNTVKCIFPFSRMMNFQFLNSQPSRHSPRHHWYRGLFVSAILLHNQIDFVCVKFIFPLFICWLQLSLDP